MSRRVEHGFDTQEEAAAFVAGIEFVNDSAIEVEGITQRDKMFIVTAIDDDGEDDEYENEGDDVCDTCMRSGVVVYQTDGEGNTVCVDCAEEMDDEEDCE